MSVEEAKQKIAELVVKYESLSPSEVKSFHEAKTKQGFIEPLFRALGWNFDDTSEVAPEEKASNGRVDYAFKLNGVSQFFLEAKPLKADLTSPDYVKQAVSYAYHKGVTWAVLTDFEEMRLFNAQQNKPFITLNCSEYLGKIDKLWLLSRESLKTGLLNKEAAEYGALPPALPIEKRLFTKLRQWREDLFNQLHAYNEKLSYSQIDEVIQRLFDRLIFIRTCEDRNIEGKRLLAAANQWKSSGYKGELIDELKTIFNEYNDIYDSELFDKHLTDQVDLVATTIEGILTGLYEIPGSLASYNFNDIDADVLGAVYEQYLGYVATKVKEKVEAQLKLGITDEETFEIISKKQRRKEQGIYYTPKFVTDYIVKETVGRFIKEHDYNEIRTIKILDPACGSGSFLIRAYDELLNYHAKQRNRSLNELDQKDRLPVLLANIYGVDLDMQAVEITRLNLLLRTLTEKGKLPYLSNNIREGNSLISGTEEELRRYFGDNWEEKKPFNWEDEFKDIMANGGFDVVIGNPPYQSYYSKFSQKIDWAYMNYYLSTYDFLRGISGVPRISSIMLFLDRAIQWVKPGGRIGFVLDQELLDIAAYGKIRKYILNKCFIDAIVAKARFPEINLDTCIIILRKKRADEEGDEHATYWVGDIEQPDKFILLRQEKFRKHANFEFTCSLYDSILLKVETVSQALGKVSLIRTGMCITREDFYSDEQLNDKWHPGLFGSNVERYFMEWPSSDQIKHTRGRKKFLCFDKDLEAEVNKRLASQGSKTVKVIGSEDRFTQPKLLVRQGPSQPRIEATYDNAQFYAHQTLHIINEKQTSLKFLLAILNSKLMGFYAREVRAIKYGPKKPPQIRTKSLATLPIRRIDFDNPKDKKTHDDLVALVEKMRGLNKRLAPIRDTYGYERDELLSEIKRTDAEIDQKVYQLYGLTEEERQIIEASLVSKP